MSESNNLRGQGGQAVKDKQSCSGPFCILHFQGNIHVHFPSPNIIPVGETGRSMEFWTERKGWARTPSPPPPHTHLLRPKNN